MSTTEIPQEIKDNIEKAINDGRTSQGTHPKIWAYYGYSLSQPLQQERDELRKEVERLKGLIADLNIQIHQLLQ